MNAFTLILVPRKPIHTALWPAGFVNMLVGRHALRRFVVALDWGKAPASARRLPGTKSLVKAAWGTPVANLRHPAETPRVLKIQGIYFKVCIRTHVDQYLYIKGLVHHVFRLRRGVEK